MLPLIPREVPIGWRSIFQQAMDQKELCIGRAVACMTASTYTRPQPGDKHFGQGVCVGRRRFFVLGGAPEEHGEILARREMRTHQQG